MRALLAILNSQSRLGVTALRVAMGVILLMSGYSKVFDKGFAVQSFQRMGVLMPEVSGPFISVLELLGGAALIVGLFTRILGVLFTIEFIVASYFMMNIRGLLGARLEWMLVVGAFVLATHGAGALGLDRSGRRWDV